MNLRKPKVNVYVDRTTYRRVYRLSEMSGRAVTPIINGFIRLTFMQGDRDILPVDADAINQFLRPGKWCQHKLFTRLPRQVIEDLGDVAWACGIKSVSGRSSGVGVMIGYCIAQHFNTRSFNYWVRYFAEGQDYLNQVTAHILPQEAHD